jgi:hypothetical protein
MQGEDLEIDNDVSFTAHDVLLSDTFRNVYYSMVIGISQAFRLTLPLQLKHPFLESQVHVA